MPGGSSARVRWPRSRPTHGSRRSILDSPQETVMLEIDAVHVGYGRSTVLHGVSMTVPTNGVAAVLGHNGAGKSTLLRAVVGLLRPRSGAVRLDGTDITRLQPYERVNLGLAYVPQGQQCFP